MKKTKPILYDPLIISRVKQYLEENVHQTYLDVGVMSKALQERYPEYSRRKIAPFRSLVEQAYKVVSQSYGLDTSPRSGDSGSDLEVMVDSPTVPANSMNSMLTSLYAKKSSSKAGGGSQQGGGNNELIDISSDETSEDDKATNGKAKEGLSDAVMKFGDVTMRKIIPQEGRTTPSDQIPSKQHINTPSKKRKRSTSPIKGEQCQTDKPEMASVGPPKFQSSIPDDIGACGDGIGFINAIRSRRYKKEVRPVKPRHTFQDIGGMDSVLKELCEILMHVKQPEIYYMLGVAPPRGLLLQGPSGCGKSLLAHAIAGQLGLALIEISATEFIAGVSGESEERIRDVFEQASNHTPCVLFIDEIDAISSNRSYAQRDMERRIVTQLISSMDNLKTNEHSQGVLVIGATTRPEALDPALRRVGRFDHDINIGVPGRKDRRDILTIICDSMAIQANIDFDKIAEITPGYVAVDLLALATRAVTIAVKRKWFEQMKEIQLKSQRNITIVDLVDEGQSEETEIKQVSLSSSSDSDKSSGNDTVPESVDTANTNDAAESQKNAKDADTESEAEPTTTTPSTADYVSSDKDKSLSDCEKMDVEEEAEKEDSPNNSSTTSGSSKLVVNEEPIDVDELSEHCPPAMKPLPEPSLFEMINMLDNVNMELSDMNRYCATLDDFKEAAKVFTPIAKREGFITVPDVTWEDVGSLQDIRDELKLAVLAPVKFPEKLAQLGLTAPTGVLLCGPPGCGKTLLAKAVANEAGINFISVKGPEMMNMYVGESERAVRACFQRARNSAPCVIFFDEFDSICPKRSDNSDSGSGTRIVNQLLTEMDGIEDRKGVYILAATNRPDIIDPAILRPGRLDTILYVGLPQCKDREEILAALTKNRKKPLLDNSVDFTQLAARTEGYTGADLAGLVRQAAMLALRESLNHPEVKLEDLCVKAAHFDQALTLVRPSVSAQDREVYEKLKAKYAAPRQTTAKAPE